MALQYEAKDFSNLKGMEGFSETLLNNHFTLYQNYVKNTNLVLENLHAMGQEGKAPTPDYAELKRRFGFEWDGMRLHEYYFGNLGGKASLDPNSAPYKRIVQDFGGIEDWKKDFISTGSMRGIGWVILYEDPSNGGLLNCWINEHEVSHLAGATPILVMDVWEHAFLTDYGLNKAAYIETFFKNVNWDEVTKRYK